VFGLPPASILKNAETLGSGEHLNSDGSKSIEQLVVDQINNGSRKN